MFISVALLTLTYTYIFCVVFIITHKDALISNNFANLMGSSIVCATIYLALAGV